MKAISLSAADIKEAQQSDFLSKLMFIQMSSLTSILKISPQMQLIIKQTKKFFAMRTILNTSFK